MPSLEQHLSEQFEQLTRAQHHDPFQILGLHPSGEQETVRVYIPGARQVSLAGNTRKLPMDQIREGLFEWRGSKGQLTAPYKLVWKSAKGDSFEGYDPYCFPPQVADVDLALFNAGTHLNAYRFLGARQREVEGIAGTVFATWASTAVW